MIDYTIYKTEEGIGINFHGLATVCVYSLLCKFYIPDDEPVNFCPLGYDWYDYKINRSNLKIKCFYETIET